MWKQVKGGHAYCPVFNGVEYLHDLTLFSDTPTSPHHTLDSIIVAHYCTSLLNGGI